MGNTYKTNVSSGIFFGICSRPAFIQRTVPGIQLHFSGHGAFSSCDNVRETKQHNTNKETITTQVYFILP